MTVSNMDKNDQSHFKLSSGSMLNIFLESDIIEQIQKIQKKQNLKDEREVIIHLIQNHYDKIILGTPKHSNIIDNEFPKNIFDGKLDLVKLDKIPIFTCFEKAISSRSLALFKKYWRLSSFII